MKGIKHMEYILSGGFPPSKIKINTWYSTYYHRRNLDSFHVEAKIIIVENEYNIRHERAIRLRTACN